jgi:hypothetical protein
MLKHGSKMILATTIRFVLYYFGLPFTIEISSHLSVLQAKENYKY